MILDIDSSWPMRRMALPCGKHKNSASHGLSSPNVVADFGRDAHAGGADAVPELHGVVDLVHHEPVGGFEEVDGDNAAIDGLGRPEGDLVHFVCVRAVGDRPVARSVGDPVGRCAVDGADGFLAADKRADVPVVFPHVFLDIEDAVVIGAPRLFGLEDGLRGVAIVALGEQASP